MELSLQLQQKQTLSLRQQQSVEILQMNALALSEYARELAEENPLVEWSEAEESDTKSGQELLQRMEWLEETDMEEHGFYRGKQEPEKREEIRFDSKDGQSLREYLIFQINTQSIPEGHKAVLRFLAESTAESGYLEPDAIEMMIERYSMQETTAARILKEFQSLDPAGVGARNLRECILIQLRQKGASALSLKLAEDYLEELAGNRLSYIAKQLQTTTSKIKEALEEIRACQPKPGSGFAGEGQVEYVVPDIFVVRQGDNLTVTLNSSACPRLQISHAYVKMLRKGATEETETYISEKLKQAEWALQCIARRENTLQQVSECIVRRQKDFLIKRQGQLAPLRLADVAEELGVHPSTVSRAVKEKYLQCDRGVFPLYAFFSKAMTKGEEAGAISADSIKERLKQIIEREDKRKPLSDRELTEKLVAEGIQISRRTVAKYREAMCIAGAGGRKEY